MAEDVYRFLEEMHRNKISFSGFGEGLTPELQRLVFKVGLAMVIGVMDADEFKDATAFRQIADFIDQAKWEPLDKVRAALVEEAETVYAGGQRHSAKELHQALADGFGTLRAFRDKIKDAACPIRKEQGKGGGRPRILRKRNRRQ